jgi:hypothetical protein
VVFNVQHAGFGRRSAAGGVSQLVITTSQLVSPAWDGRWPIIDDQPFAAFAARPQRRAWD